MTKLLTQIEDDEKLWTQGNNLPLQTLFNCFDWKYFSMEGIDQENKQKEPLLYVFF